MRIVFLGTGGGGIPPIGVNFNTAGILHRGSNALVLQPNHPDPPTLLIDVGPDIRTQWTTWPDAPLQPNGIILTHGHVDHIAGMIEFRYCPTPVPVYGTDHTLAQLAQFGATMIPHDSALNLAPQAIPEHGHAVIAGISIETVPLHHNDPLTGVIVRHGGLVVVHLTDTAAQVEADVRTAISGCDVLIVNTPFMTDYPSHISVPQAIALAQEVGVKRLILSHFSHIVPQQELETVVAAHPWVTMARDGLTIDL